MPDLPPCDGLYGRMPRPAFETQYRPLTWSAYRHAVRQAVRTETVNPYHDVLMEDAGDGEVLVLPSDCAPYPWRTLWRQKGTP